MKKKLIIKHLYIFYKVMLKFPLLCWILYYGLFSLFTYSEFQSPEKELSRFLSGWLTWEVRYIGVFICLWLSHNWILFGSRCLIYDNHIRYNCGSAWSVPCKVTSQADFISASNIFWTKQHCKCQLSWRKREMRASYHLVWSFIYHGSIIFTQIFHNI